MHAGPQSAGSNMVWTAAGKDWIICSGLVILSKYLVTGLNASFAVTPGLLKCSTCCKTGSGILFAYVSPGKNNIGNLKDAVTNLEPEYEKNSKLFHSKKEVEDLYQNISKYALLNGLSIVNLKKSEPKAVSGSAQNNSEQNSSSENNNEGQQALYYEIPVEYEIRGNFLSYLKFRRALSKSSKVINFNKEEITTLTEIQGQILSKGTISIVGLPNEYQ